VLDPQGRPVIGARVFALPKPPGNAPLQNRFAQVDDQGQFRLYQLPPGEYSVAVTYGASTMAIGSSGSANVSPTLGSGVLFYPQSFTVTSGEEYANINFSLSPGALYSVSGKLDIAPNASGTFWLALTPADQPALAAAVTQAERDGSFHLAGAGPGSYHLFASGPSNVRSGSGAHLSEQPLFGRTSLIIGAQDLEGVTVPLEKGRSLPARYETSGRECPPTARLALTALEDWAAVLDPSATLTAGTTQVVANLAPARYQASLSGLGPGCYVEATTVDLSTSAEAKPLILRARPSGSLRGRLTGATQPAAYAILLAGEATQLTVPDPAGRFEFANLRPGTYRIGVQPLAERPKSNWLPAARFLIEVEVPGGAPTDLELPAPNAEGDPSHD
ncbi:MAG: carboxypeptidase-like regulatory domain-containing protein, partial [Acidobacteria bacterium]|nr:carboxypeptidase-like regulatory domain-containing protein [Acidobacteriota bacterium]